MRTAIAISGLQLVVMLAAMARGKVLALLLGPSGYGVAATIDQLVVTLAQVVQIAAPFTAMKFLSLAHSDSDVAFTRVYRTFYRTFLPYAVSVSACLALASPVWLPIAAPDLSAHMTAVAVALCALPAAMIQAFLASVLAARRASVQSVGLLALTGVVVAVSAAVGGRWGVAGVYVASVPAWSLVVAGAAVMLRPAGRRDAVSPSMRALLQAQPAIVTTAIMGLLALTTYGLLLFGVRYLTLSLQGPAAAGLVQAALATAMSLGAIVAPISSVWLAPYLNRAIAPAEKVAAAHAFVCRLAVVLAVAGVAVTLVPDFVLQTLFSREFIAASPLLAWFVLWQIYLQAAQAYQYLLVGLDDVIGGTTTIVFGHAVSIACAALLAPAFGLVGAGMGFVLGAVASIASALWRLRHQHGASPTTALWRALGAAPLALAAADASWQVFHLDLAARVVLGLVLVVFLLMGLPLDDRKSLLHIWRTRWPGRRVP